MRRHTINPGIRSPWDRWIEVGVWILIAGTAAFWLGSVQGCGASAVRMHASANTVATAALAEVREAISGEVDRQIAACATADDRHACLDASEAATRPVVVAVDAARATVVVHREAVEIAAVGDDQRAAVALVRVWALVMREIGHAIDLARAAGLEINPIDLPEVP